MKEYTKDGIKNIEYSFEDWLKVYEAEGLFPKQHEFFHYPFLKEIVGNDKNGRFKIFIPESEFQKIITKLKEIFDLEIEKTVKWIIRNYLLKVSDSPAPQQFRAASIDIYTKIVDAYNNQDIDRYFHNDINQFSYHGLESVHKLRQYFNFCYDDYFLKITDYDTLYNYFDAMALIKFSQWLKNDKKNDVHVFDEDLLSDIHKEFNNGEIWEPLSKVDFIESFQGKSELKIKERKQAEFCFILGKIEDKRDKNACPNMEKWVSSTFKIKENTYSKSKVFRQNKIKILNTLKQNGII